MRKILNLQPGLSHDPRRRGESNPMDIGLGLALLIGLPLLTYMTIRGLGLRETKSTSGQFREKIEVEVEPDSTLLQVKYDYINKVYTGTGQAFLTRAQKAKGVLRMRERNWAKACFKKLINEIDTTINSIGSKNSGEVAKFPGLRSQIKDDLATAEALY